MAINWNPLEIQKPGFTSMEDIFKGMQNVREMNRKRAVEEAIRKGVGPDGIMNPDNIRQSLASTGFGEDADAVVSKIAMDRQAHAKSTAELGLQLKAIVDSGLMTKERAMELMGSHLQNSPTSQTQEEKTQAEARKFVEEGSASPTTAVQTTIDEKPTSQPTGSPGAGTTRSVVGETEAIIRPEGDIKPTGGVVKLTDPGNVNTQKFRTAQAAPDYASDLINFDSDPSSGTGSGTSKGIITDYTLPTDPVDLKNTKIALSRLGVAVDDKSTSEDIDAKLKLMSFSQAGPPPVRAKSTTMEGFLKADAEYNKAMKDYYSDVAKNFQKLIETVNTGRGTKFTESQAEEQLRLSQEADKRAKEERSSLRAAENPILRRNLSNAAQLKDIETRFDGLEDFQDAVARYTDQKTGGSFGDLVGIAESMIKANGQTPTMDAVESFILKTGGIPSESELKFKKALKDLKIQDLAAAKLLSWLDLGIEPKKASPTLWPTFEKNIKSSIYRRGGKVAGYIPTAAEVMEDKGLGGGKTGSGDKNPRGTVE